MSSKSEDIVGLVAQEVAERVADGRSNLCNERITKSYQEIIGNNIFTLFNLINIILASLIILTGSFRNLLFLGVVVSNVFIGIFQELRAKMVLDRLRLIVASKISVVRDHKIQKIDMDQLVLDDVMILKSGNQICADAQIIKGSLEVNESLITGESDVIVKEKNDILYSGSYVVSNEAFAKVIHVGKDNYVQTIINDAKVLKKHKSQLRDSINIIIKSIGIVIIPVGIMLFLKQYFFSNASFADTISASVAALLGMVPEGLVLLTSVALAVGSIKLAKRKTLVQELYCIETLARVDMLCLDKTGTITEGNMHVETVISLNHYEDICTVLKTYVEAMHDENATSQAILKYVQDYDAFDDQVPFKIPFSSARKYSAISFATNGTYAMGAYNFINKNVEPSLVQKIEELGRCGNRVISVFYSEKKMNKPELPNDMQLCALIVLCDPIRKDASRTLDYFLSQGVKIKIISGDDPSTVQAIAKKANVYESEAMIDMSRVADEQIASIVEKYTIFGRVSPIQKKLIIRSLKAYGHTCAMMGDGVNDVMALKEADCSIAIAQGSQAAKQISNLVLLDNNFASLPFIVAEGRCVINNIQRAASLFLVKTTFSTILSVLTLFLLRQYPFQPIQLTLVSTLTIGIPSFFLALESNQTRIEGNFLLNVLSRALPGAICVVFSILYIHGVSMFLTPFTRNEISTMCVILTGVCGINVLYRVCVPFSKERFLIFFCVTIAFIGCIVFFPKFFLLSTLNLWQIFCVVVAIIGIPVLMDFILFVANRSHLKERILRVKQ